MLRLGHDAAFSGPALVGLVADFLEEAFGFAAFFGFGLSLGEFVCDRSFEPGVTGKTEDIMNPVVLAPGHQLFAAEAGIRPKPDVNIRPASHIRLWI